MQFHEKKYSVEMNHLIWRVFLAWTFLNFLAYEDLPALGVDGVADVVESVAGVVVVVVVLDGLAAVVVAPKFDPMPTPGNPMVE